MGTIRHDVRFPGESASYRAARDRLLEEEAALRAKIEEVAALRRTLPAGGAPPEDYVFERAGIGRAGAVRLSELFRPGQASLIVYSFMYGPAMARACPMCTSFLDGLNASLPHVAQRVSLAVVAKSPAARIRAWAEERGWRNLELLSSAGNDYNRDYVSERPDGAQIPACTVFTKTPDGVRHFWSAELLYAPGPGHPRHVDLLWPIWSFFDLTPEGRGDWMPKLAYE